jgi:hypothetical protein
MLIIPIGLISYRKKIFLKPQFQETSVRKKFGPKLGNLFNPHEMCDYATFQHLGCL